MQIIGIASAFFVVFVGFIERPSVTGLFDPIALALILVGLLGAMLLGSRKRDVWHTFVSLREILPFFSRYSRSSDSIEKLRHQLEELWISGKKTEAVTLVEKHSTPELRLMLDHILARQTDAYLDNRFTALGHKCVDRWQPVVANWGQMAKLGPAFGMVGTLTGMIHLFKSFGATDANLGAHLSLALQSTLYGLILGCGVAGPIGNHMATLMQQRLLVLKRCHKTVRQLMRMG